MEKLLEKMETYANVAVKVGVNLQPGQNLYIEADVDAVEFVRIVASKRTRRELATYMFDTWMGS